MRRRSAFRLVVVITLLCCVTPAAQPMLGAPCQAKPPDPLPAAEAILAKYEQALGGRAAYTKLTSRVSRGTAEVLDIGAVGELEIREKAPMQFLWAAHYEGYGSVRQAFDGAAGWAETPDTGVSNWSAGQTAAFRRSGGFHREIRLKELYPTLIVAGRRPLDGRDAFVIDATAGDGAREQWWFNVETGLLVKSVVFQAGTSGGQSVETVFSDFRDVDGIKLPFTQRRADSERTVLTKLTGVTHNVAIDDVMFKKPGVK